VNVLIQKLLNPAMLSAIVLIAASHSSCVKAAAPTESQVKAAFLYRFTNYVEWPTSTASADTFTIAILGDSPVAAELTQLAHTRSPAGSSTQVRVVSSAAEASRAQVVYVSPAFSGDLRATLKALAGKPILVVTDVPNALELGSTVNFMIVERRVRFEVSLPSAQRAGIRISSELLSVAARVIGAQLRLDPLCEATDRADRLVSCSQRVARL
jgi:hypothetical protein